MSHLLQMYKIRYNFITLSMGLRFVTVCSVCIMYMVWAGGGMHPPIPPGSVLASDADASDESDRRTKRSWWSWQKSGNASATNVVLQCQLAVDGDSKVIDGWLASQCGQTKSNWTWVHLGKLLPCTHPDELGFVEIQLQPVQCHPSLDFGKTSRKVRNYGWGHAALPFRGNTADPPRHSNERWGWTPLQWVVCLLCRGWRREVRELFLEEHRKWPWRHWMPSLLNTPVAFYPAKTSESTPRPFRRRHTRIPFVE